MNADMWWLNATNIALGMAAAICAAVVLGTVAIELISRGWRRRDGKRRRFRLSAG